jgi:hypothetical protein
VIIFGQEGVIWIKQGYIYDLGLWKNLSTKWFSYSIAINSMDGFAYLLMLLNIFHDVVWLIFSNLYLSLVESKEFQSSCIFAFGLQIKKSDLNLEIIIILPNKV